MRNFTLIIILFLGKWVFGQVAIIKDKDGFTNVRKLPDSQSEILFKIKDSEVFSYEESENDWIKVYVPKNKYHLNCDEQDNLIGYIHKSCLNPIEKLKIFKGTEFSFKYILKEFNVKDKISDFDGQWLTKINGRRIYGTDGNLPKTEITGIDVKLNGIEIDVAQVFYEDLFECDNNVVINKNKSDYIVHQWNSDGAGAYLLVWVFGSEKLKQRLILIP